MPRRLAKCWAIWQQNFGPSSPPTFEAEYELSQRAKLTWEITTHLDACYNPGLKAKIIRGDRAVLIGRYMPPGAPPSTRKERFEFFEYGWVGQYWERGDAVALVEIFERITTPQAINEAFETRIRLGVELAANYRIDIEGGWNGRVVKIDE